MRIGFIALAIAGATGLAACSSGSSTPTSQGTAATTSTSAQPTSSTAGSSTSTSTTATVPGAQNLVVTNDIRSQLVAAGAALNSIPASDYTGLQPGETYYAIDSTTQTYWAGAALVPSSASTPAQVSVQDDGAYLLFERPQGGSWKAYDVGLAGTPDGTACPVAVPSAILQLWSWGPGTCRPSVLR